MRIFLSCLQSPERYPVPAYDFWETYFKRGLEEGGHTWVEARAVDWAEALALTEESGRRAWRDRTWSEVLRAVRMEVERGGVDVFLCYLFPHMVEPAAIGEIRRMGVPCVNFYCDNIREFRTMPEAFRCFDLNWVPEFEATSLYERAGVKHIFAPYPCWIPQEQRRADHVESAGATFVGTRDPLRAHLFGEAIRLGAEIAIAGVGWEGGGGDEGAGNGLPQADLYGLLNNQRAFVRQHGWRGLYQKLEGRLFPLPEIPIPAQNMRGVVSGAEYLRVMQESRVSLGVSRLPTFRRSLRSPLMSPRLRDVEAPMMGACYLTEWTETLARFYEIGRHVETYRTAEDLPGMIRDLLADPHRRRRLRERGQEHALRELSVPRSIEKVAVALGLRAHATT